MQYTKDVFVFLVLLACIVLATAVASAQDCHAQEFAWVIDSQPGFNWKLTDPSPECICHPFCRCQGTCRCTITEDGSEGCLKDESDSQRLDVVASYQSPLAGVALAYAAPQVCGPGGCRPAAESTPVGAYGHQSHAAGHGAAISGGRFRWRFPVLRATLRVLRGFRGGCCR